MSDLDITLEKLNLLRRSLGDLMVYIGDLNLSDYHYHEINKRALIYLSCIDTLFKDQGFGEVSNEH